MDTEEDSYCNNTPPSENISNAQLPVDYEDQTDLLKGDAIGSSLYSERYVLKILMKLSLVTENDWSEDFESDLCTLWDMTIERDIVKFLMDHNFLRIAVNALQGPLQEPRFIEIIVGILRNMSCCDNVRQVISERPEVTRLLIQLLSSSDSLTLVQLMRLFDCVAWDLLKEVDQRSDTNQVHWLVKLMDCQLLSDKLSFLLSSSTNDELLCSVLDVLNTLCIKSPSLGDKDFSQYFATKDMVSSLLECWKQLFITSASSIGDDVDDIEVDDNQVENELFLSKHMFKAAKKWIAIVASFAGHERGRQALESHGDSLSTIVSRLMSMVDEDERCEEMLIDIVIILEALIQLHSVTVCFKQLLTILYDITQKQGDIAAASKNSSLVNFIENFFEYAVRYGSKAKLSEALEICDGEDHLVLLFWSIIEKRDPELVADWKSETVKPFDERSV